jgi:predicted phage tail protein
MVQPPVAAEPRGGAAITVGAILLGLGVIVGAIGFATLDGAGVIAITVGALLLLGGLITLIVGLVLRASST